MFKWNTCNHSRRFLLGRTSPGFIASWTCTLSLHDQSAHETHDLNSINSCNLAQKQHWMWSNRALMNGLQISDTRLQQTNLSLGVCQGILKVLYNECCVSSCDTNAEIIYNWTIFWLFVIMNIAATTKKNEKIQDDRSRLCFIGMCIRVVYLLHMFVGYFF